MCYKCPSAKAACEEGLSIQIPGIDFTIEATPREEQDLEVLHVDFDINRTTWPEMKSPFPSSGPTEDLRAYSHKQ